MTGWDDDKEEEKRKKADEEITQTTGQSRQK